MTSRQETITQAKSALEIWRETVFNNVIRAVAIAGTVAYVAGMAIAYKDLELSFFVAYTLAYLWVIASAFVTRIPSIYRAFSFTFMIFALGVLSSVEKAAIGDGRVWLFLSIVTAVLFLGRRAGWAFMILATISWSLVGYFYVGNIFPPPQAEQYTLSIWSGTVVTLIFSGVVTVLSVGALLTNLGRTIQESDALASKSQEQSEELEMQHQALMERSLTLEHAAKISRQLTSVLDTQEILHQFPTLLTENYALSSAVIFKRAGDDPNFLLREKSEGKDEQVYLTRDTDVSITEDIIGTALLEGKAFSNLTSEKGLRSKLDDTRSYAAIPLRGRAETERVLVLQARDENRFSSEMTTILQALADQIAILLENTELLAKRESALQTERSAYDEIAQVAWSDFLQTQSYGGLKRTRDGLSEITALPSDSAEGHAEYEQVPIRIRGKIIGYVDARKPSDRAWTLTEKELLRTLAARLENALDSARLYEQTQQRAAYERQVSEASARMRETLNVQSVLQAAAQELHKAFGDIAETKVWLAPEESTQENNHEDE